MVVNIRCMSSAKVHGPGCGVTRLRATSQSAAVNRSGSRPIPADNCVHPIPIRAGRRDDRVGIVRVQRVGFRPCWPRRTAGRRVPLEELYASDRRDSAGEFSDWRCQPDCFHRGRRDQIGVVLSCRHTRLLGSQAHHSSGPRARIVITHTAPRCAEYPDRWRRRRRPPIPRPGPRSSGTSDCPPGV